MRNLHMIKDQPLWRVAAISLLAKLFGVLIHVEGLPLGSSRSLKLQSGDTAP